MSYTSVPTEPENATTAICGRRYSSDTPTRIFYNEPASLNDDSSPFIPGNQLRRSSKIRRSFGDVKRQSIISKHSSKVKISPESEKPQHINNERPKNEKPQHVKIVMPLPSQLNEDLNNEQESFPIHNNKTVSEIWEMPWIEENDNKFSKKFWLVFVITLLIFFGFVIVGFGIYAYYTYHEV